ncbi:MAG TPA: hypothetical protein VHP14_03935 [Anaerolineales bacterium]|nr:hypothetical protein [Anaerolineales bacterium]
MNIKSQHGLTLIVIALISITITLFAISMAANLHGFKQGADSIGETVGNTINSITEEETVMTWWVNDQRNLVPNKHAVESHGADAWSTVNCYNNNGTFQIRRVGNTEFHLLCKDDDGSIRDLILGRRSNNSKEFDMRNAFTPNPNDWNAVDWWLKGKGAEIVKAPRDLIIYVDGLIP